MSPARRKIPRKLGMTKSCSSEATHLLLASMTRGLAFDGELREGPASGHGKIRMNPVNAHGLGAGSGETTRDGLMERAEILSKLRANIAAGLPAIGAGAGTGLSAKWDEAGGIDLIVIYNSGRYRMAGRGSLAGLMPYGDANAIVVEMAREVLPVVRTHPCSPGSTGRTPSG